MDKIRKLIDLHEQLLVEALKLSQILLKQSEARNVEVVAVACEQREKLISLIEEVQDKIELKLRTLKYINRPMKEDLDNWQKNLKLVLEEITYYDQHIVALLNNEKDKTMQEIAEIFSSKEKFRGYNLKDVR